MSQGTRQFPLEPLRAVRGIRLVALEAELQRCRERHAQAERQREEAERSLEQAVRAREGFAADSWQRLMVDGTPTALAMDRHERRLALLDHAIGQCRLACEVQAAACEEARLASETAVRAWRKARSKFDAVDEMKQGWLRNLRGRDELREEHNLEELLLRRNLG
jgi:hypothetical protein